MKRWAILAAIVVFGVGVMVRDSRRLGEDDNLSRLYPATAEDKRPCGPSRPAPA